MAFLGVRINHDIGRLLSGIDVSGEKSDISSYHITLLHFEDNFPIPEIAKSLETTYDIVSKTKPFLVEVSEISCFPKRQDNPCAIIAKVESDELHDFRDKLAKEFNKNNIEYSKTFKDFKPHITLSYTDEEIDEFKIDPIKFSISEIILWGGENGDDRVFITFPFKNPEKKSLLNLINNFCKLAEDLSMNRPYALKILDLSPDFSSQDLTHAMRKLVLKNHPDQGGNSDKFRKIIEAYKFLRDEHVIDEINKIPEKQTIKYDPHPWGDWYEKYKN